jgi:hypothetical protein
MRAKDVGDGVVAHEQAIRCPDGESLRRLGEDRRVGFPHAFGLGYKNLIDQVFETEGRDVAGLKFDFAIRDDSQFQAEFAKSDQHPAHPGKGTGMETASVPIIFDQASGLIRIATEFGKKARIDEHFGPVSAIIQDEKPVAPDIECGCAQTVAIMLVLISKERLQGRRAVEQGLIKIEKGSFDHARSL